MSGESPCDGGEAHDRARVGRAPGDRVHGASRRRAPARGARRCVHAHRGPRTGPPRGRADARRRRVRGGTRRTADGSVRVRRARAIRRTRARRARQPRSVLEARALRARRCSVERARVRGTGVVGVSAGRRRDGVRVRPRAGGAGPPVRGRSLRPRRHAYRAGARQRRGSLPARQARDSAVHARGDRRIGRVDCALRTLSWRCGRVG